MRLENPPRLALGQCSTDGGPLLYTIQLSMKRTEMLGRKNGGDYANNRVVAQSVRTETRGIR